MSKEIAILCSDLHLSLTAPACRADEDWLAVQWRYLTQLKDRAGNLPILCGGDIFDRWNPPAELIHYALDFLPDRMICVAGQHDLPNHRLDEMHRSAYGVLKKTGKIIDISNSDGWDCEGFMVAGFGWNEKVRPLLAASTKLRVALIHKYIWIPNHGYTGAPEESKLKHEEENLKGYDVAVFGDNHRRFIAHTKHTTVLNNGTFIRRKADEIPYTPKLGILYSDGIIKSYALDTSKDKFHERPEEREHEPFNMKDFLNQLEGLGEHGLNYKEAVLQHLKGEDLPPKVKELVTQAINDNK